MAAKILIVDDDEAFLKMVKVRLEKFGYGVLTASDGQKGLDLVEVQRPNLILTDMFMQGMNGFTFCKKLKIQKATRDIPIIILSAQVKLDESFSMLGVEDFLSKPIDFEILENKIRHSLARAGTEKNKQFKILMCTSDEIVARKTVTALQNEARCQLTVAREPADVLGHAVRLKPDIIFLDIAIDEIPPDELIRALRCISLLKQTKIFVFHSAGMDADGDAPAHMKASSLQGTSDACREAGADEDMGHYHEVVFKGCIAKCLER